jgi:hydroxyacyl-ACP dehydratase HTD2-like protein with hotdog domain
MMPTSTIRYFEDVAIDEALPPLVKRPTAVQLFRYAAVTWNAHRIHFEQQYARQEGHADVLVQGPLHGAFLAQLVNDWAGPRGRVCSLRWSNRAPAIPGDTLSAGGRVIGKRSEAGRHLVELELIETNQRGDQCVLGQATVALPSRAGE